MLSCGPAIPGIINNEDITDDSITKDRKRGDLYLWYNDIMVFGGEAKKFEDDLLEMN